MNIQNLLFTTLIALLILFMVAVNSGVEAVGIKTIIILELLIITNAIILAIKIKRTVRNFNDKPQLNK